MINLKDRMFLKDKYEREMSRNLGESIDCGLFHGSKHCPFIGVG